MVIHAYIYISVGSSPPHQRPQHEIRDAPNYRTGIVGTATASATRVNGHKGRVSGKVTGPAYVDDGAEGGSGSLRSTGLLSR
jgi:hypothetical protein